MTGFTTENVTGVVKAEAAELGCSMADFFVRRDH